MNKKPNFSMSSHLLIATLIASSFFMVNCNNKGAGSRDVKTKTTAGNPPADKTADQKAKQAELDKAKIADCTKDILSSYTLLSKEYDRVKKLKTQNESVKDQKYADEYEKILSKCDDLSQQFDKASLTACKYKSENSFAELTKNPNQCLQASLDLKKENGIETETSKLAEKKLAEKKVDSESFKAEQLLMSDEMKSLLKSENLNFKKYIVDGEIKSDEAELKKALNDKKVVCSFTGLSTEVDNKEKVYLSVRSFEAADKKNLVTGITSLGIVMVVSKEKKTETDSVDDLGIFQTMTCHNLKFSKSTATIDGFILSDVQFLKKAFGKHLIQESALTTQEMVPSGSKDVDAESADDSKKTVEAKAADVKVSADKAAEATSAEKTPAPPKAAEAAKSKSDTATDTATATDEGSKTTDKEYWE
jgi:hypothetical protein